MVTWPGMIKVRVKELLKERDRSLYWLRNQTNIRYATLLNMRQGKTARMDLSALEALCRALECEPGDLLELKPKLKSKSGPTRQETRHDPAGVVRKGPRKHGKRE